MSRAGDDRVFGFAANRLTVPAGVHRQKPLARNQLIACLAILGLYLQLATGALCLAGVASGPDLSAAPICHAASEQSTASKSGHAPQQQHQQSCPFCALHCHAALLLPTAPTSVANVFVARAAIQIFAISAPSLTRVALAAQPRGPPRFA